MDNSSLLIVTMAQECRNVIATSLQFDQGLPLCFHPQHLLWMCEQIEKKAEKWAGPKLHRWIGFVQAGMLANRMLDLEESIALFDAAKNAYGEGDDDLVDHLNPDSTFKLDLGGEG